MKAFLRLFSSNAWIVPQEDVYKLALRNQAKYNANTKTHHTKPARGYTYQVGGLALSNNHITGTGAGNNNPYGQKREGRAPGSYASNGTGSLPATSTGRIYAGSFDFDEMIASLRELFTHDRQVASQPDSTRCGICYLYFEVDELRYREEEGFYICPNCERTLGKQTLPMIRRQQK